MNRNSITQVPGGDLETTSKELASGKQVLTYTILIVCAIVFVVHLPALSARATFHDDNMYFKGNALVRNPSWTSARRFFSEVLQPSTVAGYYQPLTMISLMVDCAIGGKTDSLMPFHRTSLALHVANTGLILLLFNLLFDRLWVAAGVALLFGLHPMTVDSICWLSERKTVLAAFFAFGSLVVYVRFIHKGGWIRYTGCLLMYVLALLAKPITLPLPMVMLLLDCYPLRRLSCSAVIEKLPFLVIGGISAVITYISQSRVAVVMLPGQYDPLRIPFILCHNIIFYLHKILWPVNLSTHYELPKSLGLSNPMVVAGVIGTCILIPLLVISFRRTRAPLIGWLIFFVAIFPTMGIIRVTYVIAANRYAYLPAIGLLLILASLFAWLWGPPDRAKSMRRRSAAAAIMLILVGGEVFATRLYLRHWRNTESLYRHALTVCPRSAALHIDLASDLSLQSKDGEAVKHFRLALDIEPRHPLAHYNLALLLSKSEDKADEAIQHYRRALASNPSFTGAQINLGLLLQSEGRLDEAIRHFWQAVHIDPESVFGHFNLGEALVANGQTEEGFKHLRETLEIAPKFVPGLKHLAWLLATHPKEGIRDPDEALRLSEQAMELTQNRSADILDVLAAAYAARGQFGLAETTAEKALTIASRIERKELVGQITERLALYKQSKPYTEDPNEHLDGSASEASPGESGAETEDFGERQS